MLQLSIFLENKLGRLPQIMEIIGKADIRIVAAMVADTTEYGILRLVTTDTKKAYDALKENNISANMSEVVSIATDSHAGAFFDKLKYFSAAGVGIEYMYSFSAAGRAFLILRVSDIAKAERLIDEHNLERLTNEDLSNF